MSFSDTFLTGQIGTTPLPQFYVDSFAKFKDGQRKDYDGLVAMYTKGVPVGHALSHLQALRKCVGLIQKDHEALVGAVLKVKWESCTEDVLETLVAFISDLVSIQTFYVRAFVRHFVQSFVPKVAAEAESDTDIIVMKRKFDLSHEVLRSITKLVPLSVKLVPEAVATFFPFHSSSLFILENYAISILHVTTYLPKARCKILSLLVDNLLSLDVQIIKHDLDACPEVQFEVDGVANDHNKEQAEKLDQLLLVLFTYLDSSCRQKGQISDWQFSLTLLNECLQIFQDVMLLTHQSAHVQFLLFFICSFDQVFYEAFLDCCWKLICDPNIPCMVRQSSACYLASFLARAKFISFDVVKDQISKLAKWIHKYIDLQDGTNIVSDMATHGPFYSTCQALFYTFIYHHQRILSSKKGKKFARQLNFMRIITSKLNPLKYCLDTVVDLFARITRVHEIVFCYSVIERNNRCRFSDMFVTTARGNEEKVVHNPLEAYFPFDPYKLPRSGALIRSLYLEWQGSDFDIDLDEEASSTDAKSDAIISEHETGSWPTKFESRSFDMMCISPGFQLKLPEM